ncbi:MAG: rod shape-determining protein MreD [Kiritimatiellae bacterium]|nr:rod shape-determining protein MreD [Kiritimatiellia bacterium]
MTLVVMAFVMIAAAVLQTLFPPWHALGQAKAPFLLGVVVYYALTRERKLMLTAGILAGLVQDSLSKIPLGYSSFCYCVVGAAINRFHDVVFSRKLITHMLFGAAAAACATVILYGLLARGGVIEDRWSRVAVKTAGTALWGMLVTPVVFHATERLDQFVGNVRAEES